MSDAETVVAYHQRTKHDFHRFAASLGSMDWANQPHPFRYYEGAEATHLELNRQFSPVRYDLIYEGNSPNPAPVNLATLSDFFYYSLALSAWKQAGTSRWALRVNPSSGNLHPTEAYLLWKPFSADQTTAELCHYVSESHSLESRASFSSEVWQSVMGHLPQGSFLVGLSSIIWREAWKYGERAFRYCQHDIGHALAALRFSAHLCGWTLRMVSTWSSSDISTLLGLHRNQEFFAGECEEPELLAVVMPDKADPRAVDLLAPPRIQL